MTIGFGTVPLALSAAVGISLALVVLRYGLGKPAHRALALFLGLHGTLNLVRALGDVGVLGPDLALDYERYFWFADGIVLVALVAVFPTPRPWLPRVLTRLWPYLALLAAIDLVYLADHALLGGRGEPAGPLLVVDLLFDAAYAFVPLILVRDAFGEGAGGNWRPVALVAIGIPLYFLQFAGTALALFIRAPALDMLTLVEIARVGAFVWLVAAFASAARTTEPAKRPTARFGALVLVVPFLTGALPILFQGGWNEAWFFAWQGVWFLATPCVLAYALLRHQLLDIDLKIRWTISKSTIAAVFIAVFFIASEMAQQFFGETIGSTYAGIAAAGALVFAIAPLQRAAERLAERAVPFAAAPAASTEPTATPAHHARREEAYRDALRIALQDRRITRDEEVRLHRLADELGIAPSRAHQILVDVEREREAA